MLYNRDISWLAFNHRVLQEAQDKNVPLYERLRFLAIFSSNLDEFFRIRYPVVSAFSKLSEKTIRRESFLTEDDVREKIQMQIVGQLNEFGHILLEDIIPSLKEKNIFFYYNDAILADHINEVRQIFLAKVLSFIQPVFLNIEGTKDFLPENNQLYLIVTVSDKLTDTLNHVSVNIPSAKLSRFFELKCIGDMRYVIFIDDIIRENIFMLFPGKKIESVYSIKFNRDAEIELNDEFTVNLPEKIEKQLSKRETGATSRFLFEKGMPSNLQMFLSTMFKAEITDMFEGGKYHNLSDLYNFPAFDNTLFFPKAEPIHYPPVNGGDIFANISASDVLIHLPYQSYFPILSFFNQAAVDADVKEIYITLYRVAAESHIVNALISAAKNGKKVTVFLELKARFDEANNIKWSRVMKNAGVRLIYSNPDIKVHSKIALIKKKTDKGTVNYAVLSTGNFNENTALFYTDHVLMTADKNICNELENLFSYLQKKKTDLPKNDIKFKDLFVTQFNLIDDFEKLIDGEIKKAKKGLPAQIRIKVNNLEEAYFIDLLYKASRAGVEVRLIVRSVCCLIPQTINLSANITVKRIVDRYLEHTRLFIFGTDENALVAMGSSDLMTRNLRRRIEVCVSIKNNYCREQLLHYFRLQWEDNTKAVRLTAGMEQVRLQPGDTPHNAQTEIFNYLKNISC